MGMAITRIGLKFYFMHVATITGNCFAGHCSKPMVMSIFTAPGNLNASGHFVNVLFWRTRPFHIFIHNFSLMIDNCRCYNVILCLMKKNVPPIFKY
nr:MAG TPA: hypothetical protein [Caudoviricetes sp.]